MTIPINQQRIKNLVWLGVGQFSDLSLVKQYERSILVESDKAIIKNLKKELSLLSNSEDFHGVIQLENLYLSVKSGEAEFYQYNLFDYSALTKSSGLHQLFPGVKLTQTITINTLAITDFIRSLALDNKQKNLLKLDIIDQALPMLQSLLQSNLLHQFHNIQIQASLISLYENSATAYEITDFMTKNGFDLNKEDSSDPDFPKLSFVINKLWYPLQQANLQLNKLKEQVDEQNKVLTDENVKLTTVAKELTDNQAKLKEQAKVLSDKNVKLSELTKQIDTLKREKETHKQERDEQKVAKEKKVKALRDLQIQYNALKTQNQDYDIQHQKLKAELIKAESQITLICDLFFQNNPFKPSKGGENEEGV